MVLARSVKAKASRRRNVYDVSLRHLTDHPVDPLLLLPPPPLLQADSRTSPSLPVSTTPCTGKTGANGGEAKAVVVGEVQVAMVPPLVLLLPLGD